MAQANNDVELYDLILRREMAELFREKGKSVRDLLRNAEIATDLGQPAFAAMIDWNLLTNVKPADYQDRDLIEDVLYCLEQLGCGGLKANFKGDHKAEFARIDAERAKAAGIPREQGHERKGRAEEVTTARIPLPRRGNA